MLSATAAGLPAAARQTHSSLGRPTGKLVRSLEGQRGRVASLAFAPDSQTLASGSNSDGLVWLWNAVRGEPILVIPEAADTCMISALGFHPEGRMLAVGGIDWLATGGSDGALCLWDLVERELITDFGSGGILCLAFHPAGRWLAAGTLAGSVVLWDVQTITRPPIELAGPDDIVTCLAYSPDGHWLAAGSDDRPWASGTPKPTLSSALIGSTPSSRPSSSRPMAVSLHRQRQHHQLPVRGPAPRARSLNANPMIQEIDVHELSARLAERADPAARRPAAVGKQNTAALPGQ